MTKIDQARAAFQRYRKKLRGEGCIRKPDYRTAFYAGYFAALDENIDRLRAYIKAHVEHEERLGKQIDFLKEGIAQAEPEKSS